MKIIKGDLVQISPYKNEEQIKVVGIVYCTGRSLFSKKQYIKIKGVKFNTYGDILYFKLKIFDYDFNKVEFIKHIGEDLKNENF